MSDNILPIQSTDQPSSTPPDAPALLLRPRPYVLYRHTPSHSTPDNQANLPRHLFSDEIHASPEHFSTFITPSDWTPFAILRVPAIIRNHHGSIQYVYPDGTAFTADDLLQNHGSLSEITLTPIS